MTRTNLLHSTGATVILDTSLGKDRRWLIHKVSVAGGAGGFTITEGTDDAVTAGTVVTWTSGSPDNFVAPLRCTAGMAVKIAPVNPATSVSVVYSVEG